MSEDAFPLQWPATWARIAPDKRRADAFKVTFAVAREDLLHELRLLGARDVVLSSNIPLLKNGLPASKFARPDDPGVAVYFTRAGQRLCVPCDAWIEPRANMRAIGLALGAIRGLERWGAGAMVNAAFAGFAALPEPESGEEPWWDVLEVDRKASRSTIDFEYRRLVKYFHPDVGGENEDFLRLQRAYEQAKAATA